MKAVVTTPPPTHLCLCIRALKARPSLQQVVKFWMLTSGYLDHQDSKVLNTVIIVLA